MIYYILLGFFLYFLINFYFQHRWFIFYGDRETKDLKKEQQAHRNSIEAQQNYLDDFRDRIIKLEKVVGLKEYTEYKISLKDKKK